MQRDGVSRWGGVYMAAEDGVVMWGSQLKAVVENQAKWRPNCCFGCSMKWHVDLVSFDQFYIHFGQPRSKMKNSEFLVSHSCDEAALWKKVFLLLFWYLFLIFNKSFCINILCLTFRIQLKCICSAGNKTLYFTQSPSCIMTCSFSLTKAWYKIGHGKVTSWIWFPGFKDNPQNSLE